MIRVIIADDEAPARRRLASFLQDYPDIELVAEAGSGNEAASLVNAERPDALFLDIQMPDGDGFKVISKLLHEPIIIFTTAYDEYALKAFEIQALDYLLKPFSKARFSESVSRIRQLLKEPGDYNLRTREAIRETRQGGEYMQRVSIRDKHVYSILAVEEISSIVTDSGLVFIHAGGGEYQTDTNLNQFEQRLDPRQFMRIHRTAIVNLERIQKIMPWGQGKLGVLMDDSSSLQVSRERMKEFRTRVGLKF